MRRSRGLAAVAAGLLALAVAATGCAKPTTSQSGGQSPGGSQQTGSGTQGAKEMTVLIRMMDAQDQYFRENILKKFEQEKGVKLNVVTFDKEDDVLEMLRIEKESGKHTIGLVKTVDTLVTPLVEQGYLMPLKEIVGEEQLQKDLAEYAEDAVQFGTKNGVVYYIPRKLETNTMLYSKSKVAEAVQNWRKFEAELNEAVKKHNGFGLPKGFEVEADPNQWDWYDLLAVGYYWANTEYNGVKTGRIAHRTRKYEGTTTEIFTKVLQAGGQPEDMLNGDTDAVVDAFAWEALQKELGIYNPRMFTEEWTGGSIWQAIAEGQVFLSFMHQIDAFFVHGGSHPTMQGYMPDPDDMGLAIMPAGVSLAMNPDGTPKRVGTHMSNASGWWWGIPATSPDPKLSYELARFITSYEVHLAESKAFGMMPIRKDVLDGLDQAFEEPWMRDVFRVAKAQYEAGTAFKPTLKAWPQVSNQWLEAWHDIIGGGKYLKDGRIDLETIRQHLKPHAEKIRSFASTGN
ncbi:MAG: extracellular solute-binding protein [Firmicutes bacterium]|nr:extracellular solute-binding protein [Bacillota bacterium]